MLAREEVEGLRRSLVAGSLSKAQCELLIATTVELLDRQAAVRRILAELPSSFGEVRSALNELAKVVGEGPQTPLGGSGASVPRSEAIGTLWRRTEGRSGARGRSARMRLHGVRGRRRRDRPAASQSMPIRGQPGRSANGKSPPP